MSTHLTADETGAMRWLQLHCDRIIANLLETIQRPLRAFVAHRALRRAEAELMALDDRMLKDIGFDRTEINSVLTDHLGERLRGAPRKSRQRHLSC